MIRHLTTLVLSGILGSIVLVGNAEACHKKKCPHAAPAPAPCAVAYAAPAPPPPAPCAPVAKATCAPVATAACAPKVKHCKFKLPTLCHKKAPVCAPEPVACGTPVYETPSPVSYAYSTQPSYPVYSAMPSAQH